jgi:plasmid replication initiation protein
MKEKRLNRTYISQSNSFINGIYDMNITQLRVFLISLAKHKHGIDVFGNEFEIHLNDLNVDKGNASKQLKSVVDTLADIKFRKNTSQEYTVYGIFRKPSYKKKQGFIKVRLDDDIKEFVNIWTENFTISEVNTLLHIPTFYSYRIYMMLKQYQNFKTYREISIDELRKVLGLENNKSYKLYGSIKQRILSVAQEHLKDTDMAFTFKEIKTGKAVTSVIFYFRRISIDEQKRLMLDEHVVVKPVVEPLSQTDINVPSKPAHQQALHFDSKVVSPPSQLPIDKRQRAFERLTKEYDLTEKQALTVLEKVPLKEVLKVLFDLNVDVQNGNHFKAGVSVGLYSMSVIKKRFDFKYKLWLKE